MTVATDGVHLASNDEDELHRFAARIGLERRSFHAHPRHPHYDLTSPQMVIRAVDAGARRVSPKTLLQIANELALRRVKPVRRTGGTEMKLEGRCAVVTGARRGIGLGIAEALVSEGASVVIGDVSEEDCRSRAEEIERTGGRALPVCCDVTSKADVDGMFEEAIRVFGKVDILVNNAGIGKFKPFLELTPDDWDETLAVNLRGQFLCAQAAARDMMKRQWGRIINIASVASGQVGIGFPNLAHYCASKGGVVAMTEALAIELSPHGINVNAIGPGVIGTEMISPIRETGALENLIRQRIPKGRVGTPEDIGHLAAFLASEDSDYITGATIFIDGGWLST